MFHEYETWMIFAHKQSIKEGVNLINLASEFESVYFDRSCQNSFFKYLKYSQR